MATLTIAIERREWETAALCLLLGITRAAAALPPDAVEGLLEVLAMPPARSKERGSGPFDPSTPLRAGGLRTGRGRRR